MYVCMYVCIALKGFLQHCVVFLLLLFCVAIVISEPFFPSAYFRPDFAAIGRKSLRLDIFVLKQN